MILLFFLLWFQYIPLIDASKFHENSDSFVRLIIPIEESTIRIPFFLQANASNDVDYVRYSIKDQDGAWHSSVDWSSDKKLHFNFLFPRITLLSRNVHLQQKNTIGIIAHAYKYSQDGASFIAESPIVYVSIRNAFALSIMNNMIVQRMIYQYHFFQNLFPL